MWEDWPRWPTGSVSSGSRVTAAIESMTGARFVHDQLELRGWTVEIADAVKVKGFAPLACKTDKIDAWVLAELSRRDVVPAIWLPTRGVRAERERARWRLRLVRHRTALMNRIHATLAFAHPYPVSDPSAADRRLLEGLALPEPWAGKVTAALRRIGDITRFATPKQLAGYTGLCPTVDQSGGHDWRGEPARNGLKYLPPPVMEPDGAPSVMFVRWDEAHLPSR
jgi:transposase